MAKSVGDMSYSDIGLLRDLVPAHAHLSRVLLAAVDLMAGHYRDPLTVDEIACRVGVSEDHPIRIFRQAFGLPAAASYVRLRIAVACRLLSDTDENMEDVARRVGYSGAANLSRAFKEVMGIRPSENRRSPSWSGEPDRMHQPYRTISP